MSPSQPVLTTGASSGIGAVHSGCFPGRFRDASAPSNSDIRILSIASHPVLREGIGAIIAGEEGISQIPGAAAGREGIEAYRSARPDVTLLDLVTPGDVLLVHGGVALERLKEPSDERPGWL